jgi:hypothetical protein
VRKQAHTKVKADWKPTAEQKEPLGKDLESYRADTLSFYFVGRDELMLRVGMEITQEEFESTKLTIEDIIYEVRDARGAVPIQAAQ